MARRRKKCPHCEFRSASARVLGGHMGYHAHYGKEWRPSSATRGSKNGKAARRADRVPAQVVTVGRDVAHAPAIYAKTVKHLTEMAASFERKAAEARRIIQSLANLS